MKHLLSPTGSQERVKYVSKSLPIRLKSFSCCLEGALCDLPTFFVPPTVTPRSFQLEPKLYCPAAAESNSFLAVLKLLIEMQLRLNGDYGWIPSVPKKKKKKNCLPFGATAIV